MIKKKKIMNNQEMWLKEITENDDLNSLRFI